MTTVVTTAPARRLHAVPAPQLPDADVMAQIQEADALHQTTCDVYDLATADLDAARNALTNAAWALTEAEEAWSAAGQRMDEAARAVTNAREAAGLVFGASGYRKRDTR